MSRRISKVRWHYLTGFLNFLIDESVTDEERQAAIEVFTGVPQTLDKTPWAFLAAWRALGDLFQKPREVEDTAFDVFAGHMMKVYVIMERRAREAGIQEW